MSDVYPYLPIETARLSIVPFAVDMASSVSENSKGASVRKFLADEVYETAEEAADAITYLTHVALTPKGPFVFPLREKKQPDPSITVGYVEFVPIPDGFEVGYMIADGYTGRGYATEAVRAFLPVMMRLHSVSQVWGICLAENLSSVSVLRKCGFRLVFNGMGTYQGTRSHILKFIFSNENIEDVSQSTSESSIS